MAAELNPDQYFQVSRGEIATIRNIFKWTVIIINQEPLAQVDRKFGCYTLVKATVETYKLFCYKMVQPAENSTHIQKSLMTQPTWVNTMMKMFTEFINRSFIQNEIALPNN